MLFKILFLKSVKRANKAIDESINLGDTPMEKVNLIAEEIAKHSFHREVMSQSKTITNGFRFNELISKMLKMTNNLQKIPYYNGIEKLWT